MIFLKCHRGKFSLRGKKSSDPANIGTAWWCGKQRGKWNRDSSQVLGYWQSWCFCTHSGLCSRSNTPKRQMERKISLCLACARASFCLAFLLTIHLFPSCQHADNQHQSTLIPVCFSPSFVFDSKTFFVPNQRLRF
ncbi:hypothetical protein HJG60_010645 [Phyllostomus discolor]|uniref:Uncharacterized protein n=1 Tax=Phyllostomus discolor TaxID=89673 RepID=A0A834ALP4_9CHIR|nr:hypothetical protein HJG60_010645 [Phyllostomus discolor]